MTYIWKSNTGTYDSMWAEILNIYGSCFGTLSSSCYPSSASQSQYYIDYFQAAIGLQKTLSTYKYLSAASISPSLTKQYSKSSMISAISTLAFGHGVYLQCVGKRALAEVHFSFDLQGSVANGIFVPKNSIDAGSCPENAWYYPKGINLSLSTDPGLGTTTTSPAATTSAAGPTLFSAI